MKIFNVIEKGVKAMMEEALKPESFRKGEAFEEYVRKEIFTEDLYTILERTHTYGANNKDFVKSSLNPDFKLQDKKNKKEFWLEVKFRSEEYGGKINWCTDEQLRRYQSFHKKTPTFVLLGIGGQPKMPEGIYLMSMSEARYTGLFESLVKKFEIPLDKPISSQLLWNR